MKNREEIEKLLLRDSGEIGARDGEMLERELQADPELARISSEMQTLKRWARIDEEDARISDATRAAIDDAARRQQGARRAGSARYSASWRPAIYSAAAALMLLLAGALIWRQLLPQSAREDYAMLQLDWNSHVDDRLSELDQLVTTTLIEYSEEIDAQRDINSLASELLNLKEAKI